MLRMINAALNNHLFFKIASHKFTVVAIDAAYTNPFFTDTIVIAPGQTVDAIFTANQPISSYYMAASPYSTGVPTIDNTTTRGILIYQSDTSSSSSLFPLMPTLPPINDTETAFTFYTNLTSLVGGPHWVPVPLNVDEHMFITVGLSLQRCDPATCPGPLNQRFSLSMNNESFVIPKGRGFSMLEAFFRKVSGVYTADFPNCPPVMFNFTDQSFNNSFDTRLLFAPKSTKAKRLRFNSTVEIVFQNTALIGVQSHPMHIHGFSFHVLALGFGNFDPHREWKLFNLINPQILTVTIAHCLSTSVSFAGLHLRSHYVRSHSLTLTVNEDFCYCFDAYKVISVSAAARASCLHRCYFVKIFESL
ncbi:hypothetical protein PIB30_023608 [Stylosanthes scabra]|uniref:Laccase n=1 Tax=Stylosanthes scabra TaxID=79078 RepID=A0ABU6Z9Y4_9FABA|nr:hypothetical protein [Stylosanthes scabra]